MASKLAGKDALQTYPMTTEEEDTIIHARITNDERSIRRLAKRFHNYMSAVYPPFAEPASDTSSVDEAREAFIIDLEALQLWAKKNRLVCDAEHRQANAYKKEKERIVNECAGLRAEIEELKTALERAQLERRQKVEYDQIAEKINELSPRDQLQLQIAALENDMQVIRDEHEAQSQSILARKVTIDSIVAEIESLQLLGKDVLRAAGQETPRTGSKASSPVPAPVGAVAMDVDETEGANVAAEGSEFGEALEGASGVKSGTPLDANAKPFTPQKQGTPLLQIATYQRRICNTSLGLQANSLGATPTQSREETPVATPVGDEEDSAAPPSPSQPVSVVENENSREEGEEGEDTEMGEVSEKEKGNVRSRKSVKEDKEEGEASDFSSELSEPPDE